MRRAIPWFAGIVVLGTTISWWLSIPPDANVRLPGEFEPQSTVVLAANPIIHAQPGVLWQMIDALHGRTDIVLLVANEDDRRAVEDLLQENGLSPASVFFVTAPHRSMWIRDYGPLVTVDRDGKPQLVDATYDRVIDGVSSRFRQFDRSQEDHVGLLLAGQFGVTPVQTSLTIDGGLILSNGEGVVVTTSKLLHDNSHLQLDEASARKAIAALYGARTVVFLEPIPGEPTGHVDVMATFTSSDTVVVGALDSTKHPQAAAALDRNAAKLAAVNAGGGRLQVVRIPMPDPQSGHWPSYTNVVYANGALLVPAFPGANGEMRRKALSTYARLLPGWEIVDVDGAYLLDDNAGPHCAVLNLGPLRLDSLRTGSSASGER